MVHCITSSEPDSGDVQPTPDDWRIQGLTKEMALNQPSINGKTYVESTVTTGIQVGNHVKPPIHHLTLVDMHQQADTTHPDNTYESQEHMDTSSQNCTINANNIGKSRKFRHSYSGHYSSAIDRYNDYPVENQNNHNIVQDHADYTLITNNKLTSRPTHEQVSNAGLLESQSYKCRNNDRSETENLELKSLVTRNEGVYLSSADGNEKVFNFPLSTRLYPHLYDCRNNTNGANVVNNPTSKPFVNQFVNNQFIYVDESDDETDDSSSDDD